jgi:hypothetical protein
MKEKALTELYFSWLYDKVKQDRTYVKLCKELHKIRFRWTVHNDDNRASDGVGLRDIFIDENNLDERHLSVQYLLKGEATVFEVMVALALRMNDLMYELNDRENHAGRWFREMLMNLKLAEHTDNSEPGTRFEEMTEQKIWQICDILMDRTYDYDGSGSLFPMKRKPPKDMRKVEIWYQLMLYLTENYGH